MNQLYTRRNILISLAISLALVSFFVWYTYRNMKKAELETRTVNERLQSLRAIEELMDDMQDIETGNRGYIISSDKLFLEPYYAALEDLKEDTVSLKKLYPLFPERKETLERLLRLVEQKAEFSKMSVEQLNKYNRDSAYKQVQSGRGYQIMDSIRQINAVFENEDRVVLQYSNAQREKAASVTAKLFGVLAIVFTIILVTLFLTIRRDLKIRDLNEKKVSYLADMVEQTGDAIISADTKFTILSWNKGAEEMYGYSKEEAIGKQFHLLLKSKRNDDARSNVVEMLKKTGYYSEELEYNRKNGQSIIVQASYTLLRSKDNTISGCSIVHRDITEKKKSEQLLLDFNEKLNTQVQEKTLEIKEVLDRFKIITKATNDVVWDADLRNGTVWWNDNFYEQLGYKSNDGITSPHFWDDHIHPEDRPRVTGHINYVLQQTNANIWSNEYRFRKADGSYVNIYDRSYVMRDDDGKAYRMIGSMADVTDLFIARKELIQSEEKYRTLVEQATDGIFVTDVNGKFILVNSSACKLSKFSFEELMTMSIYDIVDKEELKRQPFRFAELREGKNVFSERILRTKEGDVLLVEVNARLLSDGRLLVFIRDITEKKKTEEEVVKSNARFLIISKATSDIVWDWNLLDDSLWWNDNYYTNLGYKKEKEIVHINDWYDRIHSEDVSRIKNKVRKAFLSNDSVWRDEYRYQKPDGTYLNFLDRGYIMRDKDGKAYRMIGSMADITDLFLTREELKQSEERYRSLIEQASDLIMIYSIEGNIYSFNQTACSILGYTKEEFSQLNMKDVLVGNVISSQQKYQEIVAGGTVTVYRQFKTKQGQIIEIEVVAKLLSDGKVLAFGRDVTERTKAEEALRRSELYLRGTLDATNDGILTIDNTGKVINANNRFAELWRIPEQLILQKDDDALLSYVLEQVTEPEAFLAKVKELYKSDRAESDFIYFKDKRVFERFSTPLMLNEEIVGRVWSFRDITERRNAETNQKRQFDELQQLYNLSVLIEREQSIEKVYSHAMDSLVKALNADRCSILLFDADNVLRYKGSKGLSEQYTRATEGHSPWDGTTQNPAPIFITNASIEPSLEKLKDVIINEGIFSIGFIPLIHNQKLIGKFTIYYNKEHYFTVTEIQFAKTIAQNVAFTVSRSRANEALTLSEIRYHTLVDQAADAIALFDSNGKILEVNNSSVQLLGYSNEELMQMGLTDILTNEDVSINPVQYDVLEKGNSTIKQRKMRRKDGSIVVTEVNSKMLPDGRFLSMIRNLTDRIEAQEQIEKEKELSDHIIDSLPGVFYFYDETGKFIRWNRQFEIVTGYSSKEIAEMHPSQFFEGEDKRYIEERIATVFSDGIGDAEADFTAKDGTKKQFYFKAILVDFEGKPCLLGTGIDISDRKKAEKELNDSYDAIRKLTSHLQNVREEDRAHIAREIHDELGQQLTVLKMDISWINKRMAPTDESIKQKIKDLLEMLDQTVRSVRRISSELRPSLLDDLGLTAAMEWQLHEFNKRSEIKTTFIAPEVEIKLPDMVKTGLFRIFQESLTNVARHANAKKLKVKLAHEESNYILSIEDDGKGFDKEKIADKRTLGLLGMKERTTMIGGTYEIASVPGKGTKVVVSIPVNE